jgi:hypothetical protein
MATNVARAASRVVTGSGNAMRVPFIPSAVRTRTTNPRRSHATIDASSASRLPK